MKHTYALLFLISFALSSIAQKKQDVRVVKDAKENKVDIVIGGKPFATFFFPDTLEKPVLYPIRAANGTAVTRGYPLNPRPGDATDHPHHIGLWLNYESVNGLDFWNNSFAIPPDKKKNYGWIKTDRILETKSGSTGSLTYHANWVNQNSDVLLEEKTIYEFSGNDHQRIIDRITVLTAKTDVNFKDVKDGFLGLRVAHELQMPAVEDKKYTDAQGVVTVVKGVKDSVANGNYLTSEGKEGDSAWSTRATWCKMYGKMGNDSISIVIIDHPKNPNYPTFWHARGYGLFAANPLGEKVFTNGKSEKNLQLKKGESVAFRYRVVIDNGKKTISPQEVNAIAQDFSKK